MNTTTVEKLIVCSGARDLHQYQVLLLPGTSFKSKKQAEKVAAELDKVLKHHTAKRGTL